MLTPNMKSLINQLWDKFWSGGISNPLTAIEQISYLLFMRRLDELDTKQKSDAEFTGDKYTSIFEGKFKIPNSNDTVDKATLRWSHFKQMEGGEMLRHVQTKVFPFIKQLNGSNTAFARHMEDAVFEREWAEHEASLSKAEREKEKYLGRAKEAEERLSKYKAKEAEKERKAEEFQQKFEKELEETDKKVKKEGAK